MTSAESLITDRPPVAVASTADRDPRRAAATLAEALRHPGLGCVLFFCSAEYDLEQLGPALGQAFGDIPVTGCTSAGEITPRGYSRGSVVAIGFDRRWFASATALIRDEDPFALQNAQTLIERLLQQCRNSGVAPVAGNTFAITLLDGLSSHEELLLATLNAALGNIPQFGGSAGDDERLANTHVYYQGSFHARSAVLMLITTPLPFDVFTTHHLQPGPGPKLVVTAADSETRTVHELNAEPAATAYARAAGVLPQDLSRDVFALRPLAVRLGEQYYARSVQRVNPDGSLTFYCAVETGIVMTPMAPASLQENLLTHLERTRAVVGEPLITIGCDCFLRRLEAELAGVDQALSGILEHHRVAGFSTYGEQYQGVHLNQTFTGVAIGRPESGHA